METQVGLPIQFIEPVGTTGFRIHPAVISALNSSIMEIRVFPADGSPSYIKKGVKHYDFVRPEGLREPYWRELHDDYDLIPDPVVKQRRSFFSKWW